MRVLTMVLAAMALRAQPQTIGLRCAATGDPALVRSEGVSEPAGAIVLTCVPLSATAGTVSVALSITASTSWGNRVAGDGTIDATLEVDKGTGMEPSGARARPAGANGIVFDPVSFPMPASGYTAFRVSNLRASGGGSESTVAAFLASNAGSGLAITNNPVRIGVARRALAAAGVPATIECRTAADVQNPTFSSLLGSDIKPTTMRVTETTPAAFEPQQSAATNGTRLVVRYTGFPRGAHVWVPNVIAGSSTGSPTSAGGLGLSPSAGAVVQGGLVLARVALADENGAGGTVVGWSDPAATEGVFQVPLVNGAATVAYEVVSADPNQVEFAHIPTFVCVPAGAAEGAIANATVSLGPISIQQGSSATAPVPRYAALAPGSDCDLLGDCENQPVPAPGASGQILTFRVAPGATAQEGTFQLGSTGAGLLWTATVTYRSGVQDQPWLKVSPTAGTGPGTIRVTAEVASLPPGTHEAEVHIDGRGLPPQTFRVVVEVSAAAPQTQGPPRRPRLTSVAHGADGSISTLVPGSLATIRGTGLEGILTVSMDGLGALILAASPERIDFVVPESLGGTKAQLVVTVAGERIDSRPVALARMSPAIFPRGVFNQDWSEHAEARPERAGNHLQVYATGLPMRIDGTILARIHDREVTLPAYAGPAPGLPGIQQVNLRIPDDLRPTDTNLWLCGVPALDPAGRVCSLPARIRIGE